jgi:hypothetical protein
MDVTGVPTHSHHVGAPGPTVGSWSVTLHWRLFLLTLFYTSTSSLIRTVSLLNTTVSIPTLLYLGQPHIQLHRPATSHLTNRPWHIPGPYYRYRQNYTACPTSDELWSTLHKPPSRGVTIRAFVTVDTSQSRIHCLASDCNTTHLANWKSTTLP